MDRKPSLPHPPPPEGLKCLFIIKLFHILITKIYSFFLSSKRLRTITKMLITEVYIVQQKIRQKLIQADRKGRSVWSNSLMIFQYKKGFLLVLKGTSYSRDTEH